MSQLRLRPPSPTIEASAAVARSALEDWHWAVSGSTSANRSDQERSALRDLVAWYEQICIDEKYDGPAPRDGLDALTAQESGPDNLLIRRVVVTHWAVHVAQELAEFRRRRAAGDDDPGALLLAHAKLDLALSGAIDRLS